MENNLKEEFGEIDIYLFDQLLKGRFDDCKTVLDAGCGFGRNLYYFLRNGYRVFGIDQNPEAIVEVQMLSQRLSPENSSNDFSVGLLEQMNFPNNFFDVVICSAVLHFAANTKHFFAMIAELVRLLKPGGNLFIRMTSNISIEEKVKPVSEGVYLLPDGSNRFLLTRPLLAQLMQQYPLSFAEDFKTVNVADLRCMSTLVLQKF